MAKPKEERNEQFWCIKTERFLYGIGGELMMRGIMLNKLSNIV